MIPKQELVRMDDYDDATIAHCMIVAKRLITRMKTTLSDIHFVYLAVEGLEIPHRHIHLIPYPHGAIHPHVNRNSYDTLEQESYHALLKIETLI